MNGSGIVWVIETAIESFIPHPLPNVKSKDLRSRTARYFLRAFLVLGEMAPRRATTQGRGCTQRSLTDLGVTRPEPAAGRGGGHNIQQAQYKRKERVDATDPAGVDPAVSTPPGGGVDTCQHLLAEVLTPSVSTVC